MSGGYMQQDKEPNWNKIRTVVIVTAFALAGFYYYYVVPKMLPDAATEQVETLPAITLGGSTDRLVVAVTNQVSAEITMQCAENGFFIYREYTVTCSVTEDSDNEVH